MSEDQPILGAVRFGAGDEVDKVLEKVARRLSGAGRNVEGFLQFERDDRPGCCSTMYLEPISGGESSVISQNLGRHSSGCRLDPVAMATLCGSLAERLGADTDLLVVNRFGKGEATGQGFRTAIEQAFANSIPVLIAVRESYLSEWEQFTAGAYQALPPDADAIMAWAVPVLEASARRRAA